MRDMMEILEAWDVFAAAQWPAADGMSARMTLLAIILVMTAVSVGVANPTARMALNAVLGALSVKRACHIGNGAGHGIW
jgi:hypothetical protein